MGSKLLISEWMSAEAREHAAGEASAERERKV